MRTRQENTLGAGQEMRNRHKNKDYTLKRGTYINMIGMDRWR
jgi:hypothetical protein